MRLVCLIFERETPIEKKLPATPAGRIKQHVFTVNNVNALFYIWFSEKTS